MRDDYFKREMETAQQLTGIQSGGRELDIGAGVGKAMTAFKRDGWDVYGIEPSLPFYEKALSRMDIDPQRLRHNSLEDAEFDACSFDFVAFGAVLEHLYDPAFAIKRALGWLKPGGVIQIEVPSSDYLWHKILNSWYRISGSSFVSNLSPMHSPYHIFEFSLKSFEELGKKEGFRVSKHWYEVASGCFIQRSLYWFLRPLMQRTDAGMQLSVYLQKEPVL